MANLVDYAAVGGLALLCLIAMRTKGFFDLEQQFVFYSSYHTNTVNKWIHFMCIWPILWTAFVFFAYTTPWSDPIGVSALLGFQLNWSAALACIYGLYYLALDTKKSGFAGLALVLLCWYTANQFMHTWWEHTLRKQCGLPASITPWHAALVIHLAAWVLQFIGHGAFEGRAPALFDNLAQALIMAPYFVLLEGLFVLGFRKGLQGRTHGRVVQAVRAWHEAKAK